MKDLRCSNCNSLLAKVNMQNGKVEIKCKCGTMNKVEAATSNINERRGKETGIISTNSSTVSVRG